MVSYRDENEERVALNTADIQRIKEPSLLWQYLFCGGFWPPLNSGLVTYCHSQVGFRLNTDGTGFFTCKECNKSESLWNHTTTDHKEGGQSEDRRSVGASSCISVDGTGQRVHSLMFMIIIMIVVITYPPFSTITSSRYPVPFTVIKLWITIMQLRKTFP